jgi:hypothetical protein
MAGASPIALILGSGPRVGSSIAKSLAAKGYQIVVTSRHGTGAKTPEGYLSLKADFSKPDSIPSVFDAIKSQLNTSPSVVVYNAAAATTPPKQDSVLSLPLDNFNADLNVNTVSAYVAAQQAVLGWETLPADTKKSFIYTGNILNVSILPVPFVLTLGTGKAASAFWLGLSDATYAPKSFRYVEPKLNPLSNPISTLNICTILGSFTRMSAMRMVRLWATTSMVLLMASFMPNWPARNRIFLGTPPLLRARDTLNLNDDD